jgi:tRNA threonylcarbamoyladenosine biosynthesis protein TsaE
MSKSRVFATAIPCGEACCNQSTPLHLHLRRVERHGVVMIPLADENASARFGQALASVLQVGDAVALIGDLGTGKTTIVSHCVRALGVSQPSSPTFALVNEYSSRSGPIWHIDLYRLESQHELAALGLDDIVGNRRGMCFVEWADKFAVMQGDYLEIRLSHLDTGRAVSVVGHGRRGAVVAAQLVEKFSCSNLEPT